MKTIILGNTIETLEDLVEEIDWHVVKPCEDPDCDGEGCPAGIHFRERPVFVDDSGAVYETESVSHGCGSALVRFELALFHNAQRYGLFPLLFDLSHPDYYLEVKAITIERATNEIEMAIEWDGDA